MKCVWGEGWIAFCSVTFHCPLLFVFVMWKISFLSECRALWDNSKRDNQASLKLLSTQLHLHCGQIMRLSLFLMHTPV